MTTDDVLSRLEGIKRNGSGWIARCPAHEDRSPSLSVGEGDDGRVLLHCQAGCETSAVCAALGLEVADLMPPKTHGNGHREIVETYDYTDETDALLFQVVRFSPKDFRQRRPNGKGSWDWKVGETRRVLYRLRQVMVAVLMGDPVYVCEGEKDVEAIERAGCAATCNPGGAGKWRKEYSECLRGADVVIVADSDEPGRKHAMQVAAALESVAASIRVVQAAVGKDASDHLAAGLSLADLTPVTEATRTADEQAEVDHAAPGRSAADEPAVSGGGSKSRLTNDLPRHKCTDTGNAERFVDQFSDRVRYCATWRGWLVHDGRCWRRDDNLAAEDLVSQALRGIYLEALDCAEADRREALGKWAVASESAMRRRAALECARSARRVAARPADFDRDPWLLNCTNGTLDLRTGELRPHSPADMLTKLVPVAYYPSARSALWERVLDEATGGDAEKLTFLQRAFGYAIAGSTIEECFFVLVGATETTKSTITNAVRATLGDYGDDVKVDTFLRQNNVGGNRGDLLKLAGVRMGVIAEAVRGTRMDEGLLKTFVSSEPLTVAKKYQNEETFTPTTKLFLHTNYVPKISEDDDAVWRRARIVPFDNRPERIDKSIKPTLCNPAKSGAAILAWLVEGCRLWQAEGLGTCAAVDAATRDLRAEMSELTDFWATCCVFERGAWVAAEALLAARRRWAQANGLDDHRLPSGKAWRDQLNRQGANSERGYIGRRRVRGWAGLRLAEGDVAQSFDDEGRD